MSFGGEFLINFIIVGVLFLFSRIVYQQTKDGRFLPTMTSNQVTKIHIGHPFLSLGFGVMILGNIILSLWGPLFWAMILSLTQIA
jgi:hypothetical protein